MSCSLTRRLCALGLLWSVTGCFEVASVSLGSIESPEDVAFIDAMVPRHETAIAMADMELERGSRDDLKAVARSLKDGHSMALAAMKATRKELADSDEIPALADPHANVDLMEMEDASAEEMDRKFLMRMIPHHSEVIELAYDSLSKLKREDMKRMARGLIEDRAAELDELDALLVSL